VLVYKHPGLHFGDIHVLTSRYIKDIDEAVGHSRYAILFPTSGPRSLADEMANSDYDGDMYWVSINAQVSCLLVDAILDFSMRNIAMDSPFEASRTKV
jgi:RNA-dependent RNA polymerase